AEAQPIELCPRLLGEVAGAGPVEELESLLQRLARAALLPPPPLDPAEREQGAAVVDRGRDALVLGERARERGGGIVEPSLGREDQPAAAGTDRDRPGAIELGAAAFEPACERLGSLQL